MSVCSLLFISIVLSCDVYLFALLSLISFMLYFFFIQLFSFTVWLCVVYLVAPLLLISLMLYVFLDLAIYFYRFIM